MNQFILSVKNSIIFNPEFSGGKGSNLARLKTDGFNVPPFFILSSYLYDYMIKSNSIDNVISKALAAKSRKLFSQIQTAILSAEIPESVTFQIKHEFNQLTGKSSIKAVAIRSSAIDEDLPDYSFAGQLESYLDIRDEQQLLESIKKCWASLWNERVQAYTAYQKGELSPASMAVVVQQMIPVEISGICFTCHPVDSKNEILLIEAHRGIGADIVGGKTTPAEYFIDRKTLEIDKIIYPKNKQQLLSAGQLNELAKLCLKIEDHFSSPQDIEWGLYEDRFYIFQSRPITSYFTGKTLQQKELWCNYFFAERFPQPVSPLGWSILKPLIEKNAFRQPLHFLGFHDLAQSKITRTFFGRPYTKVEVFKALHYCFPTHYVSSDKRTLFYDQEISTGQSIRRIITRFFPIFNALLENTNWIPPIHLRNWNRFLTYYSSQIKSISKINFDELSNKQLWNINLHAEKISDKLLKLHRWSITFAELIYHFLGYLIQKWVPQNDAKNALINLHRGLQGNKTVEMNLALWRISQRLKKSSQRLILMEKSITEETIDISICNDFFEKYGHRSTSLDIAVPTLAEDKLFVVDLINQYQTISEDISPELLQFDYQTKKEQTLHKIVQILSQQTAGYFKQKIFKILLSWSQQFVLLRENQRFYWHQVLAINRTIFIEIGTRFYDTDWLGRHELIFFLTRNEIADMIRQKATIPDIATKAMKRCEQQQRWKKFQPPALIDESLPITILETGIKRELIGIGVSPGVISGKARVLTDLKEMSLLQADEILVVPTTDPGWTPLFGIIKGVVMEVGGVLSHGAIIAREFGIPAVTNVERATSLIRSGMQITVDGNEGLVWINEK